MSKWMIFTDYQERARKLRERMLEEERLREWSRPREDLELDDLLVCTPHFAVTILNSSN